MRGVVPFGFAPAVGAIAGVLGTSHVALASWVSTGDYVSVSAPLAGGRGGPFLATNKTTGTTFKTLCIEWSEVVKPGRTYYATVDDKAYFGGGGAVNGADPLSMETSYLYKSYVRGTLDGVVIGSGGTAWKFNSLKDLDLRALQDAVWWFEQERVWTDISARLRAARHLGQRVGSQCQGVCQRCPCDESLDVTGVGIHGGRTCSEHADAGPRAGVTCRLAGCVELVCRRVHSTPPPCSS